RPARTGTVLVAAVRLGRRALECALNKEVAGFGKQRVGDWWRSRKCWVRKGRSAEFGACPHVFVPTEDEFRLIDNCPAQGAALVGGWQQRGLTASATSPRALRKEPAWPALPPKSASPS